MSNDSIGDDRTSLPDPLAPRAAPSSSHDGLRSIGDQHTYAGAAPPGSQPAVIGTRIGGRYEILRLLGRGGMGEVYLCRDHHIRRDVAIKRLTGERELGAAGLERFRREAHAVAQLTHPNIVALFEHGDDAAGPYFVMEHLEGSDLGAWVRAQGALPVAEVLRVAREICKALAYAHGRGLVHRDLKPTNLFRLPDGSIKLLDFGLARVESDSGMSMSGVGMGTLDYAAPEQREDASKADARSDLWSLGATLYYLSTGRSPRVLSERQLPEALRELVVALTMELPHERPPSVAAALELVAAAEQAAATGATDVASDDLRCPKCKAANTLEAKLCRSCQQSLRTKCPACGSEHRLGLAHCDQCGASGAVVGKAEGLLAEARKLRGAGRLDEADGRLAALSALLEGARLGTKARTLPAANDTESKSVADARREAQALVRKAAERSSTGHAAEALAQLDAAQKLDAAQGARTEAARAKYAEQVEEIGQRLDEADRLLDHAERAVKSGELAKASSSTDEAERLINSAPAGDVAARLQATQRLRERVQASKAKAANLRERALDDERATRPESALAAGREALALDRSLAGWLAELENRMPGLRDARSAAVEAARREMADLAGLIEDGRLRDAEQRWHAMQDAFAGPAHTVRDECRDQWAGLQAEITRRRAGAKHHLREAGELRGSSQHEAARAQLEAADRLERGLESVASAMAELPGLIARRDEAVAEANTAAAAWRATRFRSLRQGLAALDAAQARLDRDAPGWEVDDLSAARARLAQARRRWRVLQFASLLLVAALALGWVLLVRELRAEHQALVVRCEQARPDPRSAGDERTKLALAWLGTELESSLAASATASQYGLWWVAAKKRGDAEDLHLLQQALADPATAPRGWDPSVAALLTSRLEPLLERLRAAALASDKESMQAIVREFGEWNDSAARLDAEARALRATADCAERLAFEGKFAAWRAAVEQGNEDAALAAKLDIQRLPSISPTCKWAQITAWEPDPAVVADAAIRSRIQATGLPWRVKDRRSGIDLILVPPGTYTRGASPDDREAYIDERPSHEVTISSAFYLGRYEVTQAEWSKLMGSNPSDFQGERLPVENVSWADVQAFLGKSVGLRLPTEGEWEYACRAGTEGARYGELDGIAWYDANSGRQTREVGGKQANAFGLHDMLGNVWEWCSDWYDAYGSAPVVDPAGPPTGSYRVLRGGSWRHLDSFCRASDRNNDAPADRYDSFGFRVARTP